MLRVLALTSTFACLTQSIHAGEPIAREGQYWVQTRSGAIPVSTGVLRIRMRGGVTVRGDGGIPSYRLRTRVRARSEGEARNALTRLQLRTTTIDGAATLILSYPKAPLASAEL